jgi:acyl-CoA reductase-like NAD-dependent aldehyde dehydrogenase
MRRLTARDPRTGARDYSFAALDEPEVLGLVTTLRKAQPDWAGRGLQGRGEVLSRFAAALETKRRAVGAALETDTGRRRIAQVEIDSVIGALRGWSAIAPSLLPDGWTPGRTAPHIRHAPQWSPYPLVGAISPWNFPLLLGMIDVTPALMAGCAVILKPSEVAPRFIEPLQEAIAATPPLDSVFAIAPGDGLTGAAVVDQVDCLAFTGSVATGRTIAGRAAERLIPAFLELGGKDPMVILNGASMDAAVDAALRGSTVSTGQACQSIERIYVARPMFDAFVERLTAAAAAVRLNWPDIGVGDIGPIIFEGQAEVLRRQLQDAVAKGARVHCGGQIETHGGGLWLRPTVLTQVTPDMAVMREETFGPIMPVTPFETEEEAVALANATEFGLSAAVFGPTLEAAEAVGRRLDAGAISLNDAALTALFFEAPKQSFKASGLGPSRIGPDALMRYVRRKALIANMGKPAPLAAFRED